MEWIRNNYENQRSIRLILHSVCRTQMTVLSSQPKNNSNKLNLPWSLKTADLFISKSGQDYVPQMSMIDFS